MSVRIRLKRMGRKNHSFFRIAAFDNRTRRDGRAIEYLGFYDPHQKEETKKAQINQERVDYWLSVGAKPSETCKSILLKRGVEVPGCGKRQILTPEEVEARKRSKEERARKREEAKARKAVSQPKKLTKAEIRAAKRAGG